MLYNWTTAKCAEVFKKLNKVGKADVVVFAFSNYLKQKKNVGTR